MLTIVPRSNRRILLALRHLANTNDNAHREHRKALSDRDRLLDVMMKMQPIKLGFY